MATPRTHGRDARRLGKIGPNAIVRAAEAIEAIDGAAAARAVFRAAGIERYLGDPPAAMVPETEVAALHRVMHGTLGDARARSASWIAGQRTARYLLAHRIPGMLQALLRALPAWAASRLLMRAIARNAWTFVGSGNLTIRNGNPTFVAIGDCPLCRGATSLEPCCDFYAATFEHLFARLVHGGAAAVETACAATGAAECRFKIAWPR